ncbi:MAG: hypothetical protein ABGF52_09810 [Candidatus Asgardarchaeum sp.]
MIRVVLDASVIVKWFVKEIYSDIALKLREDYLKGKIDIIVPSLVYYSS